MRRGGDRGVLVDDLLGRTRGYCGVRFSGTTKDLYNNIEQQVGFLISFDDPHPIQQFQYQRNHLLRWERKHVKVLNGF